MEFQEFEQIRPTLSKEEFQKKLIFFLLPDLRREVAIFISISKNDDYFVLDHFYRKHNIQGTEVANILTSQLQKELEIIGWKTKLVFGGTSIYILHPNQSHVSDYFDEILQ